MTTTTTTTTITNLMKLTANCQMDETLSRLYPLWRAWTISVLHFDNIQEWYCITNTDLSWAFFPSVKAGPVKFPSLLHRVENSVCWEVKRYLSINDLWLGSGVGPAPIVKTKAIYQLHTLLAPRLTPVSPSFFIKTKQLFLYWRALFVSALVKDNLLHKWKCVIYVSLMKYVL